MTGPSPPHCLHTHQELIRKLLLTGAVVLMDVSSPLPVTLAVLFSCWAHVLHATLKPWGVGTMEYCSKWAP